MESINHEKSLPLKQLNQLKFNRHKYNRSNVIYLFIYLLINLYYFLGRNET